MKKLTLILTLLLQVLVLTANSQQKILAVFDLDALSIPEPEALAIAEKIRAYVIETDDYVVVERRRIQDIMKEMGFQQCTSSKCVVDASRQLGAEYAIVGSISLMGKLYSISLRMIDINNGQIVSSGSADIKGSIEDVVQTTSIEAIQKLLGEYKPKRSYKWVYAGAGAVIVGGAAAYYLLQPKEDEGKAIINVPVNP